MLRYVLFIYVLLHLNSCVYYGDIHGHSKPLTVNALQRPHRYHVPEKVLALEWWARFHDAQLNQLVIIALSNNPTMQIAENRVRQAKYIAQQAISPLFPSVDLSGYVQRQKFSEFGLVPPPFNGHTFNIGEVGLNFNYEFDFWGKNRQTLAARISEACAAQADFAQARLVISAAVVSTYFQLQYNIAALANAEDLLAQQEKQLTIIKARAQHGIQSDIPVTAAINNRQSSQLLVERYQEAKSLNYHQLAILLGNNPFKTDIKPQPFAYHAYKILLPKVLPAHLLANRPDILATRFRAEAACHAINVAKTAFYPDVNLMALLSYQSVGLNHLFNVASQNNSATAAVDLPIFDAGARRANLGARYAEYDLAVNQYNQTILVALREVADGLSTMRSLVEELQAQNTSLAATERNYKLTLASYRHGIVDYVHVLNVKLLLLEQRSAQIDLQARHVLAAVETLKALGGEV